MVVGIHQLHYLPWLRYFHKIACSDVFVILDNIQSFLRFVVAVGMMLAYTFVWIDTNNPDHLLFLTNFPLAFLFGGVYHVLQLYKISNLLFGDQILRVYDKYVLVCDPEGRIVYCNEHVLTELNLPEEYLLGEGWWGILGVRKPAMAGIREAIRTRMAGDLSAEVFPDKLLKPGRKQPCTLQWEYQVIESGYLMGIGTDVSERIEQETMIRTLSLIASTTENMVVITDMDRKIEWVNSSFCRTTGYSFEEVHGQNPDDLLQGPETDHHIAQTIRLALQQGQPWRGEVVNYAKSGRPFWVMIDLQPILDEKDQVHKFVSLSIDVTEKKLREIEMLKAIEEGEQKYKLISDNTSDGIAILDAAGRFVFTSPSYLDILRYPAQTYLDADQAAIAALNHPEDRDIPIRANLDPHVELPNSDQRIAVFRIVQEAVTNALRHAQATALEVSVSRVPDGTLIRVQDDGRGFDVHARLTPSASGMGLFGMRERVHGLGGTFSIESQPGHGTLIHAHIPATGAADARDPG